MLMLYGREVSSRLLLGTARMRSGPATRIF